MSMLRASNVNASLAGVLINCVRENGRDNSAFGDTIGKFYATTATEITGNTYYIPEFQAGQGSIEVNMNFAAAWFQFSYGAYGWLGAQVKNSANNGEMSTVYGHSSIALGNQFVDQSTPAGYYTVNLTGLSAGDQASATSQKGVLLVSGGKNEDNYALSRTNADGTFTVVCHNSSTNGVGGENDPIAFAYVPLGSGFIPNGAKDPTLLPMGRIMGNGATDIGQGSFTITKSTAAAGTYILNIPGYNDSNGTLIVSMETSGTTTSSANADNAVSYAYDASAGGWVIQSRDLPGCALESPTASDSAFSFAFLPDNADIIDRNLRYDSGEWALSNGNMWYNTANWSSNAIPSADGVEAKFGGNLLNSDTISLDEGSTRMVGKMTFNNNLAGYTIGTAGTTASVMLKNSAGTSLIDVQAGSHTINVGLKLTGDAMVKVAGGSNLVLGGSVKSPATANLTLNGPGIVLLGSSNTFTTGATAGKVTVNGTLDLNGYNAGVSGLFGNGVIDNTTGIDAYTLTVGGNDEIGEFSGQIRNTAGTIALNKIGAGTLTLSGANSYSGNTAIEAGTLKLAAAGTIANSPTITAGT